ncbi:MAG: M15 family metallopeptidase [Rhodospirillales bacterium]|nr:M15 family metallopeptidase [Rhodospirillales bacterium]
MLALVGLNDSLSARDFSFREDASPVALVHLRDIDPSILQDIRYAGSNNFTGQPVPGYAAAECLLLRDVAEALSRVQNELRQRKLSLRVYDCYRPRRAVRAFREWVRDPAIDPLLKRFHPNLDKGQLMGLGYIASVSRHSRGDTVDLTLVALPAKRVPVFKRDATYASCAGPAEARAPDNSIDMGTSFDCFDPLSHTKAVGLAPEQQRWRELLADAMAQHGFRNYKKEWWHFTYLPERRGRSFDLPVTKRQR